MFFLSATSLLCLLPRITQFQLTHPHWRVFENIPIVPALAGLELFNCALDEHSLRLQALHYVLHTQDFMWAWTPSVAVGYMHNYTHSRFPHRSQHSLSVSSLYLKCFTLTCPSHSPGLFHLSFKDKFKSFVKKHWLSIPFHLFPKSQPQPPFLFFLILPRVPTHPGNQVTAGLSHPLPLRPDEAAQLGEWDPQKGNRVLDSRSEFSFPVGIDVCVT